MLGEELRVGGAERTEACLKAVGAAGLTLDTTLVIAHLYVPVRVKILLRVPSVGEEALVKRRVHKAATVSAGAGLHAHTK